MKIDTEKLEKLVNDGLTLKDISNSMNMSLSSVKRWMSKLGLKTITFSIKSESKCCLNCEKNFTSLKTENRKFCCSSCSSIFNNSKRIKKDIKEKIKRIRIRRDIKIGVCINCKDEIIRKDGRAHAKYCSLKCQSEFNMNHRISSGKASTKTLKLYLIKNNGNKCMRCGWCEINEYSNKVPLELEHIDGNSENNELENLTLLCPNCHSLTSTYKALNKGNGRHKRMERYKEGKSY